MVDLLGMFRRRAAKRGRAGFARSRADITALGDGFGEMLASPVRDAPPIARDEDRVYRIVEPFFADWLGSEQEAQGLKNELRGR